MWSLLLLGFVLAARAQVSLPSSPWLPPNATAGTQSSAASTQPNPQWATVLGDALYFYEAQRSGKLPSTKRVSWRNDSAVNDGSDVKLDLSGGYYDAGDYIKCTYPLSFTIASICWGATDFGKGYDAANQTAYLDDMLRWGLDWLIKAHPSNDTLYVQVADGDLDNAYWGGDLDIPTNRPSYQINDTNPGTDAAAAASAAFSACSILYSNASSSAVNTSAYPGPASLQNKTYAQTLLSHAQQLYAFAQNASGGHMTYQTSVPAAGIAYASSSYGDELALAALFLAQATNSSTLYGDAQNLVAQYGLGGAQDVVLNWDSKTPALAVLFAQIASTGTGIGGNLSGWQNEAETYFDRVLDGSGQGRLTGGGLLYYDGDSDDASLNPALNAAMLLLRYAPLASTSAKKTAYTVFAQKQIDYLTGNNPMSAPYIVGINPNAPQNPHSAMASGGSDIGEIDTSPAQEAYVLYGAVVGGPDARDNFWDIRSDWPETEVGLDYNAPLLTLAAMQVANASAADPYYVRLQAGAYARPAGSPCDAAIKVGCQASMPVTGKIVIGVVVGVMGLLIVALALLYMWTAVRRRTAKSG
ncbi:glycoside hydrolase family 9 protein [Plicaturopsis crispa FD-325 SS-3]|nr:glycoside hydrolase family 9 protein [Plicaturopsis crispa FD-325 SS-3]